LINTSSLLQKFNTPVKRRQSGHATEEQHITAERMLVSSRQQRSFSMRKDLIAAILAGFATSALVATSGPAAQAQDAKAPPFTGQKYVKDAKVSLDEARAIALKTYAGEIVAQELEKEKGGSGLRYSFDIKNGKVTHEIGVDAKTGKVLENSVEGTHHD
jgi:uncharacterized membrane protein YkoI